MTKEEEKYTTLDTEQCKWWVNTLFGMAKEKACNSHNFDDGEEIQAAQDKIINALEIVEEFEKAQIITSGRLNGRTYAYKCGLEDGKRKALEQQPCEDCVSRMEVLRIVSNFWLNKDIDNKVFSRITDCFNAMPYVLPKLPTSNDCVRRKEVFEIMGNLMSIPYDFDRQITEKDVSESIDEIRALPPVTPIQGTCKDCKHWCKYDGLDTCKLTLRARSKDFYCADFEKRGNENEHTNC